jgi:hypothetical protein
MLHSRRDGDREDGQIMILFALCLVVILVFASIVVDLGVLRNNRQILVNTMDAAALAGGTVLPIDGSKALEAQNAQDLIVRTLGDNYPDLKPAPAGPAVQTDSGGVHSLTSTSATATITYRCLVGIDASSPPKPAISRDVPLVCDPHNALMHNPPVASDFVGAGSTRNSDCKPSLGDKCNVVVVTGSATTRYGFGNVVGIASGSTGTIQSASCNGPCGAGPGPVDVVLIVDRTASMDGNDTTNAKNAAKSVVSLYNPAVQWLGFSLLGPSKSSGGCATQLDPSVSSSSMGSATVPGALRRWVPIGLSGAGLNQNGLPAFDSTFAQVTAGINCYDTNSYTDLADTISEAQYELLNNGRTGVRKGIILMTDGQPNTLSSSGPYRTGYPCNNTDLAAQDAKSHKIEIFAIGFGLDGTNNPGCDKDTSGNWHNKTAVQLLVSVASPDGATGAASVDRGCPGPAAPALNSNNDGDHYYCIPKSSGASTDLSAIFLSAGTQLARGGASLVQLSATPVVTGVSPASGSKTGGNTVTITGVFFTGATAVSFGGTAATNVTVVNDTTITAKVPAGTSGTTVDITVTTPGGTTTAIPADLYTYTP